MLKRKFRRNHFQRASFSTANRREFLAPTILDYRHRYFYLTLICSAYLCSNKKQ
ncbi:hypothetical protein HMPREF1551_02109 [Capnocytophaga sp. oral taxon 863 str. F0517]|nr:hypothetical protein HMPREF1551_02109 [Capnocytophaga sp. oral taxon 863 str. F0517]